MSGGEWLIRQHRPASEYGGYLTERITVEETVSTASGREPNIIRDQHAITFEYADGRIQIFPWANIVSAEYRPYREP